MKRASLTVPPPSSKIEPADLTDRLLDREAGVSRSSSRGDKQRRGAAQRNDAPAGATPVEAPAAAQTESAAARATAPVRDTRTTAANARSNVSEQTPRAAAQSHAAADAPSAQRAAVGAASVADALLAAAAARQALHQAARLTPARFDTALRYRLDALAHHIQQVADFVNALAQK